jgi:hypothetical protein
MKTNWLHRMFGLSWHATDVRRETAFVLYASRDGNPCPFWSCLVR